MSISVSPAPSPRAVGGATSVSAAPVSMSTSTSADPAVTVSIMRDAPSPAVADVFGASLLVRRTEREQGGYRRDAREIGVRLRDGAMLELRASRENIPGP